MTQQIDYTQTMNWVPDDPAILVWQIKTIAHQWQRVGYVLVLIFILCFALFISIIYIGFEEPMTLAFPIIPMIMLPIFLFGEIRRKVWLVYRVSGSGIQCCYWRAYPKALFTGIRVIFIGFGLLVIIIGLITEAGLMVLVGPVGIALGLGSFAFTKDYEKAMINLTWCAFMWNDVLKACYDEKKQVIDIYYDHPLSEKDRLEMIEEGYDPDTTTTSGNMYLFLTPELTKQAINLVEKHLPIKVSLIKEKVILPTVV